MKKFFVLPIASIVLALGLVGCSASDDELTELGSGQIAAFSLLSYSKSEGIRILQDGSNSQGMDETLTCKILQNGRLLLMHKNVVFDEDADIKLETALVGNKLLVTEMGSYGQSGIYAYYTLTATVGKMTDGDYTIVVKRNANVRAEFKMTYDSSKAK